MPPSQARNAQPRDTPRHARTPRTRALTRPRTGVHDTATTADFERVLDAMFAQASAAGEPFLDVSARTLHAKVSGTARTASGLAVCCRLMRRMVIPGDSELCTSFRPHPLFIRFRIPR